MGILDAPPIPLAQKGAPSGVATLDVSGLLSSAQLPPLAVTDVFPVTSQAAMLALTAQRGDIALRTDLDPNQTFILAADNPAVLANWKRATLAAVSSVNGYTGTVALTSADVGAVPLTQRGAAGGVPTLDASGKVPAAQLNLPWIDVDSTPGADDCTRLSNAITVAVAAMAAGARAVRLHLAARVYDWSGTPPQIPRDLPGLLLFSGCGEDVTTVKLTGRAPRFLDFGYTAPGQTFQNVVVQDLTVDSDNLTGLSMGGLVTVNADTVVAAGGTTVVPVTGSTTAYATTGGSAYFVSGARAGSYMAQTAKTANSITLRNDGATPFTLHAGDQITGSLIDHVVLGTMVKGGTVPQWDMSFQDITVRRVKTVNVATDQLKPAQTSRVSISITPTNRANGSTTFFRRIYCEDLDLHGGASGVVIAVPGKAMPDATMTDIFIRRLRHTTGVVPTLNYASSHVQLGGSARGGYCKVEDVWGEYSGDVGIEIDNFVQADVTDCVVDDAFGGSFFCTNFHVVGLAPPAQTTISNAGAGIDAANGSIKVASTAGFKDTGYLLIGGVELVWYSARGTTTFSGLRGMYSAGAAGGLGSGATYNAQAWPDGAVVIQADPQEQLVTWTRCHSRRTRLTLTGNFTGSGFYQYKLGPLPCPNMKLVDCTYVRTTGELVHTTGEVLHVENGPSHVDVEGLEVTVPGLAFANAGVVGTLFYIDDSHGYAQKPAVRLSMKRVRVHVSGAVTAGGASSSMTVFAIGKGPIDVDFDDWDLFIGLMGANPASTTAIRLYSDPQSYVSGSIRRTRLRTTGSDGAPRFLSVGPVGFTTVRSLVLDDIDLRDLAYSVGVGNVNYAPFQIDDTNAGRVRIGRVRHAVQYQATEGAALAVAAAYTMRAWEDRILAAGTFTVTLPGATRVEIGRRYTVKNTGSGVITVAPGTGTIDGAASKALGQYDAVTVESDGTNWWVI